MKPLLGLLAAALVFQGFTMYPSNWIGTYGAGHIVSPHGMAVDANGATYVADVWTRRVEKFSKAGTHLLGWGGVGSGPGQFQAPGGVAIAPSGEIYVTDMGNNRVQRFNGSGAYLGEFGSTGSGNGQFQDPHAIAISAAGDVYVADTYNHRVQKFTANGTYVTQWGVHGSGDGQLDLPYGIAVDAKGNVYVADSYNHRIQKFTGAGAYLKQWGSLGTGQGQFQYPYGIAVDAGGSVYVADTNNHRIQRYTSKGLFLCAWGVQGNGPGEFFFPQGVAIGPDEDLHVSDTSNSRMQVFRRKNGQGHEPLLAFGGPGSGNGQFSDPRGVAISKDGYVYVADKNVMTIQKFTLFGSWVNGWGAPGDADGEFNSPVGVAVDTTGNVYVVDHLNHRVQKFSANGAFLARWGGLGTGNGQFTAAWDIAIDDSNRVYVVDAHRVQRFTTDGAYVTQWSCPNAQGIGVDAEGYVYVACSSPDHMVRKFSPSGQLVLTWGGFGNGVAQFNSPADVVCDRFGYVYVADANDRVQQFTPMGGYIEEWGMPGSALRELGAPTMMAADAAGSIYIAEFSNFRVQKFASPPEVYKVEDVPNDEGGSVKVSFVPSSAEQSPGHELYQYRMLRFDPPSGVVLLDFAPGVTSVVVPSGKNATDVFDGFAEYDMRGLLAVPGSAPLISSSYGFSTDDLAPPAPSPFTAVYVAGATWLHWGVSPATDLAEFRLSRAGTPIHASPDTGYADVGPAGGFYSIVAVDTSGNVSDRSELGPDQTVDTPAAGLAFALEGLAPNPAVGTALTLRFSLPDAVPARLELVNVAGRSVWSRSVQGAGPHALRPTESFAPGIYFVRLTRGAHALVRRAVILD